jgi:hypothetical protein
MVNLSGVEWLEGWRAFRRQRPAAEIVEPQLDNGASCGGAAKSPDATAKPDVAVGRDRTVP